MAQMLDSMKAARLMRRAMLPLAILMGLLLYLNYGWLRVPTGMDSMSANYPPGTLCLIDKRPSGLARGSVVFVDLPDGGSLIARVTSVAETGLYLAADNPGSRFADLLSARPFPRDAIRALVLTGFKSEPSRDGR